MKHRDTFSGYHPVINLFYFSLVLAFAMILMHPVCLCISLAAALCCSLTLGGKKAIRGSLLLLLADTLSRCMGSGSALPVGAITSLLGAPFFIAIIFSRKENRRC